MTAPDPTGRTLRPADSPRAAVPRDAAELRTVALAAGAIALFVYFIRSILLPFLVAAIIAYLCTPLLNWLAARTRLPRSLFAGLLFVLLIGCAGLFAALAGPPLVAELADTANDLQHTIEHLVGQATGNQPVSISGHTIDPSRIGRTALDALADWFAEPEHAAIVVGYSLAGIMGGFLTAVLLCYFLVGGPALARGLFWTVPPRRRRLVAEIAARLDPLLKRYFVGMLAIVIYATVAAYVGLGLILGIDHALLLALLTGILETIPIVGSTAAAIVAGLVALHTATGLMSIAAFTIYAVVLRLTIDQIVAPLVLGTAAHVHPVIIIFCFFAGAVLLGIPGVILAVPVAVTAKTALQTLYGDDAGP